METLTCRGLPFSRAGGPANMATDEALLRSAIFSGVASLRFYGWTEPTVSLGYFQPAAVRHSEPMLASLPFVRRPTGGGTLVHDRELTYALALPAGRRWQGDGAWLHRMHAIIAAALEEFGVAIELARQPSASKQVLCFQQTTPSDVVCRGAKVVGSAQRKQRHCLLQHGAILLAASPHAPMLPGVFEQTGRLLREEELAEVTLRRFSRDTGWQLFGDSSETEISRIAELVETKYSRESWNLKR